MNFSISTPLPLQSKVFSTTDSWLRKSLLILAGVIVLTLASQLSIPLYPVPLTLQSATVILIGMAYGPRQGSYVIASYLSLGLLGLPVFSELGSGIPHLWGPTGGYLLGFLPAAAISGYLAQLGCGRNAITSFIAAVLGISIIFAFGILWLQHFVGVQQAIASGLIPFIISELIKLLAVAAIIPMLWKK